MSVPDIESIAIEVLQAELRRRQDDEDTAKPACGTTGKQGAYNVPIHVFAVFLILVISTIGRYLRAGSRLPLANQYQHAPSP